MTFEAATTVFRYQERIAGGPRPCPNPCNQTNAGHREHEALSTRSGSIDKQDQAHVGRRANHFTVHKKRR